MRWRCSSSSLHIALVAISVFSLRAFAAVTIVEGNSPNVSFTPPEQWRLVGNAHVAETPGAAVVLQFTGTAIQVIGARGRAGAIFGISIDNGPFEAGTSNNAGNKVENVQLFVKQGLSEGVVHTLAMVHAGQRGQAIDVDRFEIEQPDALSSAASAPSSFISPSSAPASTQPLSPIASETPASSSLSLISDTVSASPTASVIIIPSLTLPSFSSTSTSIDLLPVVTSSSSLPTLDVGQLSADTSPPTTPEDSTTLIILIAAGSGIALLFISSSILLCCCLRRRRQARDKAAALEFGCAGDAFAPVSEAERLPVRWVEFEAKRESIQWPARRGSEVSVEGYCSQRPLR